MKKTKIFFPFIALITVVLTACNNNSNAPAGPEENHRKGRVNMYIDDSFSPIFGEFIELFENDKPDAHIEPIYTSETEAVKALLNNNTNAICITRDLSKEELEYIKKKQSQMKRNKLGEDAVCLIINKENMDSTINVETLKKLLTGEITHWETSKKEINVVFDNNGSANYLYLKKLLKDKSFGKNVFAQQSNTQVIEYVKNNPSAIGIIGVNWISGYNDQQNLEFNSDIRIMEVAPFATTAYAKPYQGLIYTREYPLIREIWLINKDKPLGLNAGFVHYMLGQEGQLIMQRANLVPGNTPIRMIQIEN